MRDIVEITITEIQDMYSQNKISVKELVEEYLKRITLYDKGIGKLNSIIEINPDVLSLAKELDEQRLNYKSQLYGVPILLKDNIDTADGMHTSAGSMALANSYAGSDADIVKSLRAKGAILLGKTNMTEFANYMTKGMKAGYSSRGGVVLSPYKKEFDPSGSSTGSAVAVTANLCATSIGTDTAGSIISPAIANGIVGYRPSINTISKNGVIPISFTLDTVGPMTRTVRDSAIMFSELTNTEINLDEMKNMKDIVIGVDQLSMINLTKEEEKKVANTIHAIKQFGVIIKKITFPPISKNKLKEIERFEFKYSINKYLSNLPKDYSIHCLKDIIEFNYANPEKTLQYGQTLLLDAENNTIGDLSETSYTNMLRDREQVKQVALEQLRGVDACILFKENLLLQYVGLPILAIPQGLYNNGMPYGITLTADNDSKLLKAAYRLEQIIGRRELPKLILNTMNN